MYLCGINYGGSILESGLRLAGAGSWQDSLFRFQTIQPPFHIADSFICNISIWKSVARIGFPSNCAAYGISGSLPDSLFFCFQKARSSRRTFLIEYTTMMKPDMGMQTYRYRLETLNTGVQSFANSVRRNAW